MEIVRRLDVAGSGGASKRADPWSGHGAVGEGSDGWLSYRCGHHRGGLHDLANLQSQRTGGSTDPEPERHPVRRGRDHEERSEGDPEAHEDSTQVLLGVG